MCMMCDIVTKSTKSTREVWHSVRVRDVTYRKLVSTRGLFELQTGETYSFDKTIDTILESAPKTKVAIAVSGNER